MDEILFSDYVSNNLSVEDLAFDITSKVCKQISRGRYFVNNYECKVEILLHEKKIVVTINENTNINDFWACLIRTKSCMDEPSLETLYDFLYQQKNNNNLLITLMKYQEIFYKSGDYFEHKIWFKLYSQTRISDSMREWYDAKWIDYEKQLEKSSIIYDENEVCGLWAMPNDIFIKCNNDKCKNRYGDKVFILKALPDCKYVCNKKEIIGHKFEVIKKCSFEQALFLADILSKTQTVVDKKVSELYEEHNKKEFENNELMESIEILKKDLKRYTCINKLLFVIIFLLMLMIIGT